MKVSVGVSNHHVHLTKDDYEKLFEKSELSIRNKLNQPGQFASSERVTVIGPKGKLENIIIVGPFRDYTQVEVSRTDSFRLGINPPIRDSGDLRGASSLVIVGPCGRLEKPCGIIANRHIHVDKNIVKEKELEGIDEVSIKIGGEKSGIINHVKLKMSDEAYFELHLDTDDTNAFLLSNNDEVEIII